MVFCASCGNGTQKSQSRFSRRICQGSKLFYLLLYVSTAKGEERIQETRPSRLRSTNPIGCPGSQIPNSQAYGPNRRSKRQGPIQRGRNVQSRENSGYQSSSYNNEQTIGSSADAKSWNDRAINDQQATQPTYDNQQKNQQWNSLAAKSTYEQQVSPNFDQKQNQNNQQQYPFYTQQNAPNNQWKRYNTDETGIGYLPNYQGDKYTDPQRIAETRALNERFYASIGGETGNAQPNNPIQK